MSPTDEDDLRQLVVQKLEAQDAASAALDALEAMLRDLGATDAEVELAYTDFTVDLLEQLLALVRDLRQAEASALGSEYAAGRSTP